MWTPQSDDIWAKTLGGSCSKFEKANNFSLAAAATTCDGTLQYLCYKPGKLIVITSGGFRFSLHCAQCSN